ncbi:MAG: peptidase [Chloroflexi bacterium]|nr:MAG: peptidase [Chloroflexota bacterium]RLC95635.1 MAG: peptidase [Chloroflexota bacterium]
MWLQTRMFLLVVLLFGILYGVITGIGYAVGGFNPIVFLFIGFGILLLQYLLGPSIVSWTMRVKWVSEKEAPELHKIVAEQAERAGIPKPRVGVSQLSAVPPNAFAFGRTHGDGRVCVTPAILRLLSRDELKAVIGHEVSHIKHRDMAVITLLSAIPLIMYWIAMTFMFRSMFGGRREGAGYAVLIGLGAFVVYFITNLLVLYGSRIREYYADLGSVKLGNPPHHMATALYKLVYSNARYKGRQELKEIEGVKAFFVNDPSRAWNEVRELAQVDTDLSGTIDANELAALRSKTLRLSTQDKLMEIMSTHPNMLKRIQHLSSLAPGYR